MERILAVVRNIKTGKYMSTGNGYFVWAEFQRARIFPDMGSARSSITQRELLSEATAVPVFIKEPERN